MDHTFKIALIHPILNFRRYVIVHAADHYSAMAAADVQFLIRVGYQRIESCSEIFG